MNNKPPIRSNSKKRGIIPIKIQENAHSLSTFEELSPSTLQNFDSQNAKLPKIPKSANLPYFFQHLNEKFAEKTEKTSSGQQIMDSLESYCNRAVMTSQKEVVNSDDHEKTQNKDSTNKSVNWL